MTDTCGCGEPLHYSSSLIEEAMREQVERLGETIPVEVPYINKGYLVPRHYIALHGISAFELPMLAERYGWEPC